MKNFSAESIEELKSDIVDSFVDFMNRENLDYQDAHDGQIISNIISNILDYVDYCINNYE